MTRKEREQVKRALWRARHPQCPVCGRFARWWWRKTLRCSSCGWVHNGGSY